MRIRTVKPEFWFDEDLAEVSRDARLAFIGLWNLADCQGLVQGTTKFIKSQLFPFDDVTFSEIDKWLGELNDHSKKFIVRYTIDGKEYVKVSRFTEHQKPDTREKPKGYPQPNNDQTLSKPCLNIDNSESNHRPNGMETGDLRLETGVLETGEFETSAPAQTQTPLPEEFNKAYKLATDLASNSASSQGIKGLEEFLRVYFTTAKPKGLDLSQVLECWTEACELWFKGLPYVKTTFKNKMTEYHTKQKKGSFTKPVAAAPSQAQLDKQHREYYNLDRLDAYLAAEVLISTAYEGLTISGKDLVIKGIDQLAFNKDIVMGDRTYYRAGTELCWTIWLTPEALERRNQAWKSLTA